MGRYFEHCIFLVLSGQVTKWGLWVELRHALPFCNFFLMDKLSMRPLGIRGQKGQVYGVSIPSSRLWGLWIPPCRFSPTLGSRHSGGSCLLVSAHSVSWLGFWTGPWCRFSPLHIYYYLASPPSCAPCSLCLPQTCSWAPAAPPLWWSHFSISAAVQGCSFQELWRPIR